MAHDHSQRVSRRVALVPACVALAALSLLLPWALAFDPQVWVMWGDGAFHWALDTEGGPTWKPLTVLVTTLLAPFGDAAEPLWLIVARTGGLLALAGAYALAERLAGRVAGVVAALAMALSPWWLLHTALGNSEGILAASILWGVVAHLAGRPRAALALAACAGLLRPEVWPFIGIYVVWLRRPEGLLALAAIGIGWLLPDAIGQDGLFAASDIARRTASPGSAQLEAVPGLAVLRDAVEQLGVAALLAAVAALVPWRRASPTVRAMALAAVAYVAIVAVSAQAGFAGNPRYLVPAAALGCVLAGIGVARLGRFALPAAAVVAVALAVTQAGHLKRDVTGLGWRADQRRGLDALIARAGGVEALKRCGTVHSGYYWRALVARRLDVRLAGIDLPADAPGVLLRSPPLEGAPLQPGRIPRGYERRATAPGWELWGTCPLV
jgi:hypothetical protein